MADFNWLIAPPHGTCLSCGSSQNDRGFVDTFAEVNIMRDGYEIAGIADAVFCAHCIEQMGNRVGMASSRDVEGFAYRELELTAEIEKLKDEIQAWQERFLKMATLDVEDFEKLAKLERASKMVIVEEPTDPAPAR